MSFALSAASLSMAAPSAAMQAGLPEPVTLTTQEDHARTMALLGITEIRRGANGSNPEADNYANYDESLATPYPHLPDPLLTNDRRRVDTQEMWWDVRRPERCRLGGEAWTTGISSKPLLRSFSGRSLW